MVTDTVCLVNLEKDTEKNTCVDAFPFLAITEQYKFIYQGVLGISPTNFSGEGPSYLQALKNAKKIDEAVVSFSLGHNSTDKNEIVPSYVIFGGVDTSQYVGPLYSF